ncbi:choice-of-anchor A family protein [Sphingomonas crocodyli]|uniref:Choice-of-anchor A family protein n=2 Tax=Sphingomonas crocodyli TaxID=1979270 RepID=A0A437M591_9SPHN|nr:choice-of-anchor A family protein [Sphingomonas crocodyli]
MTMRWTQMVRNMSVALLAFAAAGSAQAAMIATPVTNTAAQLKEWNLIAFNNIVQMNSEIEGRTFVGGNIQATNGQYNFTATSASANGTGALTVVGNTAGQKIDFKQGDLVVGGNQGTYQLERQTNGTTVYVGGTNSAGLQNNLSPTTGLAQSNPNFTAALNAQKASLINNMTSLSDNLKALASTGTASTANNKFTYNATGSFNVINTTVDQLKSIGDQISITSGTGKTTIINVAGNLSSGSINANMANTGSAQNIIWNFYEATDLTLGDWQGTVLAPKATFVKDSRGNLEGNLIANNVSLYGEVHALNFQGDLSSVGGSVSAMPEPTTWAMLILGFGMVGSVMRRQRGPALARA